MPHSPGHILLDAVKAPLRAVLANIGEIKCEGPHFRRSIGPRDGDVLLRRGGGGGTLVTQGTPGWAELSSPAARMLWGILHQGKHLGYCTEKIFSYPCCEQGEGNRGKEQLKMDLAVRGQSCLKQSPQPPCSRNLTQFCWFRLKTDSFPLFIFNVKHSRLVSLELLIQH